MVEFQRGTHLECPVSIKWLNLSNQCWSQYAYRISKRRKHNQPSTLIYIRIWVLMLFYQKLHLRMGDRFYKYYFITLHTCAYRSIKFFVKRKIKCFNIRTLVYIRICKYMYLGIDTFKYFLMAKEYYLILLSYNLSDRAMLNLTHSRYMQAYIYTHIYTYILTTYIGQSNMDKKWERPFISVSDLILLSLQV